jgi:hypothetical protein
MRTIAWIGVIVLALIGVTAGVTRTMVVSRTLSGTPVSELSPEDRATVRVLSSVVGIASTSELYRLIEEDTWKASIKFNSHPAMTLLHVVPGAVFLALAPLQLIKRLRDRRPAVHRSLGYLLLVCALPFALSGFYLAVREPSFGPLGAAAAVLAGLLFVHAGIRAYASITRGDVTRHRMWMLRFLAVAYGIAVIRVISVPMAMLFPLRPSDFGARTFWFGWTLSILFAEWWIRRSRTNAALVRVANDGRAA